MSRLRVSVGRLGLVLGGAVGVLLCSLAFVGAAGAALPDGRVFELVSPANANGAPVLDTVGGITQFINDDTFWFGNSVTPIESGPSGGEPLYAGSRGEYGWRDAPLRMSGLGPYSIDRFVDATRKDVSADGAPIASIWFTENAQLFSQTPPSKEPIGLFYRNSEGGYNLIASEEPRPYGYAPRLEYGGMSADGQIVVYQPPGEPGAVPAVFAWNPSGAVERLSTGVLGECGADAILGAGDADGTEAVPTNSVSEDGEVVFMESAEGGPESCPKQPQVYVNDDGVVSLVSAPSSGAPLSAEAKAAWFVGATPDGQTAYFVSRGNLTSENPEEEGDELYQWKAGQPVSCITCKAGATLETYAAGDVAVSSNGQDVWILSSQTASDPIALYLYADGRLQVASGPKDINESAFIEPNQFGISSSGEEIAIALQVTNGPPGVTEALYRVSDSSGTLEETCISCVDGEPYDGVLGLTNAQLINGVPGASTVGGKAEGPLTTNGETIVFTSAAALAPGAQTTSTGLQDVYEWNQERGTSLIAEDDTFGAMISPDGSNIFFTSSRDLTPTARESNAMLYDARVGGGFPEGSAPATPKCIEELACQGSGAAVAAPPAVSAMSSAGNLAGVHTTSARLGRIVLSHSGLVALEREGVATVRLQSAGVGTVTLSARCMLAGHEVGCARASGSSAAGGRTLVLRLRLSRAARDALAKSRRLRLSLTATLAGASAQHASITLTRQVLKRRKAPAAKPGVKHTVDASEVQQ